MSHGYISKKSVNNGSLFFFFFQAPNIDSQTEMRKDKQVEAWLNGASSVRLRSGLTANVFVPQNPGVIAGMMQKVNPFKSSQPKAADTQSVDSEFSSSTGSLADNNNQPEKQVDPRCETTLPHLNQ